MIFNIFSVLGGLLNSGGEHLTQHWLCTKAESSRRYKQIRRVIL